MIITGSEGYLVCDAETGEILDRTGDRGGEYDDIARFDPLRVSTPYDPPAFDDFDVLYIGHWKQDGTYEEPATFEREEDGEWVTYEPRWIAC